MGHADGCVWDEASRDKELKALVRVSETNKKRRKEILSVSSVLKLHRCTFYVLNTGGGSVTVTDDLLFSILSSSNKSIYSD